MVIEIKEMKHEISIYLKYIDDMIKCPSHLIYHLISFTISLVQGFLFFLLLLPSTHPSIYSILPSITLSLFDDGKL